MKIGIDFGTTHTAAAYYDGQTLHFVPLDPLNTNPALLRSMIYIRRDQTFFLGQAAVQQFLSEDTGREVIYQDKMVGTIENTVADQEGDAPITIIYDVTVAEDVGMNGRLLQSIKTGLRSAAFAGTNVFGRYYTLAELIALILRHVREQAEAYFQQPIHEAVIGRPVHFDEDPEIDQQAEQQLLAAARLAGFQEVQFLPEPVAAAHADLNEYRGAATTLVFDFGGGTLDLTVMRVNEQGEPTLLASHGVGVGGDDLDSAIMHHLVAPHFGSEAMIDRNYDGRPMPFPEDLRLLLDHWQTIPQLSRLNALTTIQRAKQYGSAPKQFAALEALVTHNHGFDLFERIEQAKRRLSASETTQLTMQADEIDLDVELARAEFHLAAGEALGLARQATRTVLTLAGVSANDIERVVTTGGSSAIPLFQRMLAREFPHAQIRQADAFSSVVSGLAIAAAGQRLSR